MRSATITGNSEGRATVLPADANDSYVPQPDAAPRWHSWVWLACAGILLFIADGRNTAALAIWPALALMLRFLRTQPMARGLLFLYVVKLIAGPIANRGMIPIPVPIYYYFLLISGLVSLVPYALDRWLAPRLRGFAGTLVFPSALVVIFFLYGHGPHGSWGSLAYTQTGNLALEQLLAITGVPGIVFLIGWFASSINWVWQTRQPRRLLAWAVVMGVVLLGGQLRLAFLPVVSPTVRVAALSKSVTIPGPSDELVNQVAWGKPTAGDLQSFRDSAGAVNNDLLARAENEARAGAKLVFWAEGNAQVLASDEAALLDRGQRLAQEYGVYVGMALYTWTPGAEKPMQNKVAMIDPKGHIAWQYWKVHLTPGPETKAVEIRERGLKTLDTPFGRIATPICFDMDFPAFLMQAGRARVDLVLSPANDWRAVDPRHTEIASFRAVEQGFNLVRPSSGGLSAAYDYQGHPLAITHGYESGNGTLVVNIPTRGVRTVYSVLGDWVVWASVVTLLTLAAFAW